MATAAAQGDRGAFTALVERHRVFIYSIAYKIALNEEDALDIAQNVLLRLVEKIGLYEGRGSFRGWLATMTSREAINYLRRSSRRLERSTDPSVLATMADVARPRNGRLPWHAVDTAQRRELVEEAMGGLSPQQRAIFLLKFNEDLAPREIALRLDIPPGQVRSQLHGAIARLRKMIAENDPAEKARDEKKERNHG